MLSDTSIYPLTKIHFTMEKMEIRCFACFLQLYIRILFTFPAEHTYVACVGVVDIYWEEFGRDDYRSAIFEPLYPLQID